MTDGELVHQAANGLTSAYGELAQRWHVRILAMCHARTGRQAIAEELAQETLLRGFRGLRSIESPESFGSWICGIAHRVCLDWRKAKQTGQVTLPAGTSELLAARTESVAETLDRAEQQTELLRQLESLPEELREVLMLYYYENLTYQRLGERLGIAVATVSARLARGRALLRKRLEQQPTKSDDRGVER